MLKYLFWTLVLSCFYTFFNKALFVFCYPNPTSPLIFNTLHFTYVYTCSTWSFVITLTTHLTNNLWLLYFYVLEYLFIICGYFVCPCVLQIICHSSSLLCSWITEWASWAQAKGVTVTNMSWSHFVIQIFLDCKTCSSALKNVTSFTGFFFFHFFPVTFHAQGLKFKEKYWPWKVVQREMCFNVLH